MKKLIAKFISFFLTIKSYKNCETLDICVGIYLFGIKIDEFVWSVTELLHIKEMQSRSYLSEESEVCK